MLLYHQESAKGQRTIFKPVQFNFTMPQVKHRFWSIIHTHTLQGHRWARAATFVTSSFHHWPSAQGRGRPATDNICCMWSVPCNASTCNSGIATVHRRCSSCWRSETQDAISSQNQEPCIYIYISLYWCIYIHIQSSNQHEHISKHQTAKLVQQSDRKLSLSLPCGKGVVTTKHTLRRPKWHVFNLERRGTGSISWT